VKGIATSDSVARTEAACKAAGRTALLARLGASSMAAGTGLADISQVAVNIGRVLNLVPEDPMAYVPFELVVEDARRTVQAQVTSAAVSAQGRAAVLCRSSARVG
jgi:hypothetical protein